MGANFLSYLKSSWQLIRKNIFLSILIVLQLAIVSFSVDAIFMYSSSQSVELKTSKQLAANGGIYTVTNVNTFANDLSKVNVILNIYGSSGRVNEGVAEVHSFTEKMLDIVNLPLYKGRWFAGSANKSNIEIVVTQNLNYKLGDIVDIDFADAEVATATVVGVLPNNFIYFKMRGGSSIGDNMSTKFLFSDGSVSDKMIFMSSEQMIEKDMSGFMQISGSYVNFSSDISTEEYNSNLTLLKNNGATATIKTMIENTSDDYRKTILLVVPFIVFIAILIIISSLLLLTISVNSAKQYLSILYLYGAKWKNIKNIVLTYGVIIVSAVVCVSIILKNAILGQFIKNFSSNWWVSALVLLFVSVSYLFLILFITKKVITKKEIINNLKEEL